MKASPILGKKILFVTAHPDDETFLAAGTIYKNYQRGGESYIFCATCGEQGKKCVGKTCTEAQLKKIRKRELLKVSRFLKVKQVFCYEFPDRHVRRHKAELHKIIQSHAAALNPDIIVGFGEDGVSGHIDHIALGEVTRRASRQVKIPFFQFAAPPLFIRHFNQIKHRRKFGSYKKQTDHKTHSIRVQIDSGIKRKAFAFHKSQLDHGNPFHNIPPAVARQWLNNEYFCEC